MFEIVFEQAAVGMALIDGQGRLWRVNQAFCNLLGYDQAELAQRHYHQLLHPQDGAARRAWELQLAQDAPTTQKLDCRYLHRSGRVICGLSHWVPLPAMHAAVARHIVQIHDVTERNTLIDLLQRWHQVFQHAGFGVAVVNAASLEIELANPAFARLHGVPGAALIGSPLQQLFAPKACETLRAQLDVAQRNGHHAFETQLLRQDGSRFAAQLDISALRFADGQLECYVLHVQNISLRKETESRLLRKQALLEEIQRIGQVGSFEYDYASGAICCSQQMLQLFGFPLDRPGRQLQEFRALIAPAELARLDAAFQAAVAGAHTSLAFDYPITARDGSARVLLHRSEIEYGPDRRPARLIGTVQDITERKQAEQLLAERARLKEQLEKIVATVPGVVYTFQRRCDGSSFLPFAAPGIADLFGVSAEALARDATLALPRLHPADRARVRASALESARLLQPWQDEFRVEHPSRGEIWIEGHSVPEALPDGGLLWYGFFHEITERKQAEALGHIREQEFRTFVENSPDIIARYDRDCRRTYLNPALEKISGKRAAEMMQRPVSENPMGDGSYVALHQSMIEQTLDEGVRGEAELAWRSHDGRSLCFHVRYIPEYGRDGRVSNVWAIGRDIAALKNAEQRLQESYDLLRELAARRECAREEERKHVAREIHDELGQILTVLRMDVAVARMKFGKDQPALAAHLQNMVERVDKTLQLVRNVASQLRPTALDMGIAAALDWLSTEFTHNTGIPCRLLTDQELIPLDEQGAVAVFRIVQESLTNIARHAGASQVEVMLRQVQQVCCLEVRDNGQGFDPSQIKTHSFGLLGMRERALMLGGAVDVFSTPGQGTTIRAHIPFSQAAAGTA